MMTKHSTVQKVSGNASTGSSGTTVKATSRAIANSAITAGKAVSKTSKRITRPLVETVKHEDNKTLTKMLVAAVAPQLINAAVRLVIRKPAWAALGALVLVTVIGSQQDET